MAIKKKTNLADELGVAPEELEAAQNDPENTDSAPIDIDLDFEAGGTQECANGTYHARLEHVEKKIAKSGNPMLVWRVRLLQTKQAFWLNTVLTRDAQWKVTETAVACGAKGEGQIKLDVKSLIGNCCRAVVVNEIYEGEMRPGIKKLLPPTEATFDLNDLG